MQMKIGFVGLGRMGRPMASNMQRKGFAVTGFDLNAQAGAALVEAGGSAAATAADAARDADVVFTMLPNSPDVLSVVANDILPVAKKGAIIVDMSTIDPLVIDQVAALAQTNGRHFADAPVGRLAQHADRGESLFMVGATGEVFAAITPLLQAMKVPLSMGAAARECRARPGGHALGQAGDEYTLDLAGPL